MKSHRQSAAKGIFRESQISVKHKSLNNFHLIGKKNEKAFSITVISRLLLKSNGVCKTDILLPVQGF